MNTRRERNPLIRDGTSQQQRYAPALEPNYVKVDESDLADFLVFVDQMSQYIQYYNLSNQADGSWQTFFERSTPVQLARISKTCSDDIRREYDRALKQFLDQWAIAPAVTPTANLDSPRLAKLEKVIAVFTTILNDLQTWYWGLELDNTTSLTSIIRDHVKTDVEQPFTRLYQLNKAVSQSRGKEVSKHHQQICDQFVKTFFLGSDGTPLSLNEDGSTFNLRSLLTNREAAKATLNGIFQPLFQTYFQIIDLAQTAIEPSLFVNQKLDPHIALLVAFWRILQPAQSDLNQMTQRHLDFFYREVLRLSEKSARPDKAHLILELANPQASFRLPSQTRFTAGKDATGVDLVYTLDQEIVVNRAQVADLKGVFFHRQLPLTSSETAATLALHVSPKANSLDGLGTEFPKDHPNRAWSPFGNQDRPTANVGLAIASNVLLLREGDRQITFEFTLGFPSISPPLSFPDNFADQLKQVFRVDFSGEQEWIMGETVRCSLTARDNSTTDYLLTLEVRLPVEANPVQPYHADLPGAVLFAPVTSANQTTSTEILSPPNPVVRIILCHQDNSSITSQTESGAAAPTTASQEPEAPSAYHYLHSAALRDIRITTRVKGVRSLTLQNDLGILDPTKPFQPFGSQPKLGANFYIGSQEVFQKQLTQLQLFFALEIAPPDDWQDYYAGYGVEQGFKPDVTVDALDKGQWYPTQPPFESNLFKKNLSKSTINLTDQLTPLQLNKRIEKSTYLVPLDSWTYDSKYGFLRLQLTKDDFRHAIYPSVLARQVLAIATQEIIEVPEIVEVSGSALLPRTVKRNKSKRRAVVGAYYQSSETHEVFKAETYYVELNDEPIRPREPYTPAITALQLDYTATAGIEDCQFFHLHPFDGFAALPDSNTTTQPGSVSIPFLPQFEYEGELLIGLIDLEPASSLSLLVQVAEETANTTLDRPKVEWHYLKDNQWQRLEEHRILSDTSGGLSHAGIIQLAIPQDISNTRTTILHSGLHWIKATVASNSAAVGHLISIQTQAAEVTFVDSGNDPKHLAVPLPADRLTQLADPQPEIKKIQHPFPSFGGKTKEQPVHFYTRISEHLHHKGRAITIFDYERLVLARFPGIAKVCCINHAQFKEGVLHEVVPGNVTLAVIPTLPNQSTLKDLKPKVNDKLLREVEEYIQSFSSPWTTIRTVNPKYEEIQLELSVRLKEPFSGNFLYYKQQLKRELVGFLSPWTVNREAEINFGGELYLSSILKFLEELEYVDYVRTLEMRQDGKPTSRSKATASTGYSVLVSAPLDAPSTAHIIKEVTEHDTIHELTAVQQTRQEALKQQRLLKSDYTGKTAGKLNNGTLEELLIADSNSER